MTTSTKKYSQQFRKDTVELFLASDLPIAQTAGKVGVKPGTLGKRIKVYRGQHPEKSATDEQASVLLAEHQQVVGENAKLKQEVEILGKVSAFFARSNSRGISTSSLKQARPPTRSP